MRGFIRWTDRWMLGLAITLGLIGCMTGDCHEGGNGLAIASFSCDVTPPLGHPLCGGWIKPLESVDDPLLAKGILLSDGKSRYVLCAVDWCLLQTGAYDQFRKKLAVAAEVPVSHVAIQTVHQHNAPIADVNAQLLLNQTPQAPLHLDLHFMDEVTDRVVAAVQVARQYLQPFTHIGYSSNRVERFASNRRVRLADGIIHPRFSSTKDPALQAAPEGLVDPWLRTVTFFNGERPLVRLHYYASHPQSYYGDGRATSDTVGLAREQLEREEGIPQIYFTGCAGNITAGKYNDGSLAGREQLCQRMHAAMQRAATNTFREVVRRLEWKTVELRLAARTEPEWAPEKSRQTIENTNAPASMRLQAALNLAWSDRLDQQPVIGLSGLTIGSVKILNLPGEVFVEYQLYAQSLCRNAFVVMAAYGEGGPGYICTDAALDEGGYEPTDSRAGPPSEFRLRKALAELLGPDLVLSTPPEYSDKAHLLAYRDAKGFERPIKTEKDWRNRRADILANMQLVMGPLPNASRKVPLEIHLQSEERLPGYTRQKITFRTEADDRVPAYLLIPERSKGKARAMLCLHQTTSLGKGEPAGMGGREELQYARELAERGYVTLAPDYPNFGDYRLDVYKAGYFSATMKGIWNHMRAVDLLESLPQVDRKRIGVIGHSLGGHNALFVAAFDPRLKAVITSCGFNSFFAYAGGDLTGWSHAGYMPRIATIYGSEPGRMPFDFTEVLAALAPRPVFISAPMRDDNFPVSGVKDCVIAAGPVYRLLGAAENLMVQYPDAGHEFPPQVRQSAYEWLSRALK
jgi:dienelactone hydrolase